jgi:chemotaxis protein methyltransferase CheR
VSTLAINQFERIAALAFTKWGLSLTSRKLELVSTRINKYLSDTHYTSVEHYLDHVETHGSNEDMLELFDLLSTNVTSFFRENHHFDYLEREFYTPLARGQMTRPSKRIRVWSAACSTGQEPFSLAIQALELLPEISKWDYKILGTDLSNTAVSKARQGVYPAEMLEGMDKSYVKKYFMPCELDGKAAYSVKEHVRNLVTIRQLNLMETWPFGGKFDVIFCRNVMIYFDQPTKLSLIKRMADVLMPEGILAVGSAESANKPEYGLRIVQPSVYVK